MRSGGRKFLSGIGLVLAGGYVMSGIGSGCSTYLAESALSAANFCFIFDCQNGLLGGAIDPCAGTGAQDQNGELPLFTDCPDFVQP